MCDVDIVPWLLDKLMAELKLLVQQLSAFVPKNIHLPTPPFYCIQPASSFGVRKITSIFLFCISELLLDFEKYVI